MLRSMVRAQLGLKQEALEAYQLGKSTPMEKTNAPDDVIRCYFSECTSLLQEKGYLPVE